MPGKIPSLYSHGINSSCTKMKYALTDAGFNSSRLLFRQTPVQAACISRHLFKRTPKACACTISTVACISERRSSAKDNSLRRSPLICAAAQRRSRLKDPYWEQALRAVIVACSATIQRSLNPVQPHLVTSRPTCDASPLLPPPGPS